VVRVTASVGLVEIQRDMELSYDELLAHADIALYAAKEARKPVAAPFRSTISPTRPRRRFRRA
jgi:GGDEF domain-containing protein